MSRCFPFPPPGYEKKARTDDVDLLKKEKPREKKHKKEKRESKEKRNKEGRDGKHKEKKDKKEKHREQRKDKDGNRDKEKCKISAADEKVFPGQALVPNAVNLHQKQIKQNDKKGVLFEEKLTRQFGIDNEEKAEEKNHLVEDNKDSKFLLELDRRIKDNSGGARNNLVQSFTIADHRKDEGGVRLVAKGSGTCPDDMEKLKDKDIDARKIDERGIWAEIRPIGNATVQNDAENFHPRLDKMPRPLEKNFGRTSEATAEGKEKVTEKKDDKWRDKRKHKEKEKKGLRKDKDKDKTKKKEEKAMELIDHINGEQNKLNENNKAGPICSNSFTQVSKTSLQNATSRENLKKRKDIESNGVLHANDNWPSKVPRSSSSHLFAENGRILEPCQISLPNASHRLGAAANAKADNKERKANGIVEPLSSVVYSNKTPTATVLADPVTEASAKPPHPDTRYLSQVYSVPKTEEWSDFDDQKWLFGSNCSLERKHVVESSEVGETLQVWAEGVHIEPADVFALPYVIPY